jgi:DNA mismatch endonuclease, patch repair protein
MGTWAHASPGRYAPSRSGSRNAILCDVTDTRTPEVRRRIMSAVRQRDTAPELELRRALYGAGVRGWRCNYSSAPGRPDIAWPALQVAVFVDGAFWHGHPSRHRPGRSGVYWDAKIEGNMARDRRVDDELRSAGWEVVRLWDFEVRRRPNDAVQRVRDVLRHRVAGSPNRSSWQRALSSAAQRERADNERHP